MGSVASGPVHVRALSALATWPLLVASLALAALLLSAREAAVCEAEEGGRGQNRHEAARVEGKELPVVAPPARNATPSK